MKKKASLLSILKAPRTLLASVLFLAVLLLGVRLHDVGLVITGQKKLVIAPSQGVAEDAPAPETETPAISEKEATKDAAPASDEQSLDDIAAAVPEVKTLDSVEPETMDDALDQGGLTRSELDILQQLAARRTALDGREKLLDQRETLLNLAENRLDTKVSELQKLKGELEELLGKANSEQQAQLTSLVKIYETMKPKEAARIFETMDLPALMSVVQRMKEARAAPVLAEMAPEKAKELTMALMQRKQKFALSPDGKALSVTPALETPAPETPALETQAPDTMAAKENSSDAIEAEPPASVDLPLPPAQAQGDDKPKEANESANMKDGQSKEAEKPAIEP